MTKNNRKIPRSRTPGKVNPPGTKFAKATKDHMITKRGRRPGGTGN